MTKTISNTDDVIDLRDVIARYEELVAEQSPDDPEAFSWEHTDPMWRETDEGQEIKQLMDLLEECRGNGGDHQWRGDWYPVTLVHASYFVQYAEQLAEDCGMIDGSASWPNCCIDWDKAADALRQDYTEVDFAGQTYLVR